MICFDKKTSEKWRPRLFFCNWQKEPYDENGKMLIAEKVEDRQTKRKIPTGRVFNHAGQEVEPADRKSVV